MNRRCMVTLAVLTFAAFCAATKEPETLEQLKARAEATQGEHRALVFTDVVLREIEVADKLFTDGDAEKAHTMVKEAVTYAQKAGEASRQLAPKKMKDVEIALRKAENRLNAVRRTLALEDQQDVQEAAERIHQVRTDILNQMFAPKHK